MTTLIQLISWLLFGFIGFRLAENLNDKYNMEFDSKIWAALGFLLGVFGLLGLGVYAYFKIKH
jgi:hypothetical protein